MLPGVLPPTPVRLTCCGVLLTHTPPDAASARASFVVGMNIVYGANTIGAISWSILGFIVEGETGMVWLLIFLSNIYVASVSSCFIPIASVSKCLHIACMITLYVTFGHYV